MTHAWASVPQLSTQDSAGGDRSAILGMCIVSHTYLSAAAAADTQVLCVRVCVRLRTAPEALCAALFHQLLLCLHKEHSGEGISCALQGLHGRPREPPRHPPWHRRRQHLTTVLAGFPGCMLQELPSK
jgi:hypothetical protein